MTGARQHEIARHLKVMGRAPLLVVEHAHRLRHLGHGQPDAAAEGHRLLKLEEQAAVEIGHLGVIGRAVVGRHCQARRVGLVVVTIRSLLELGDLLHKLIVLIVDFEDGRQVGRPRDIGYAECGHIGGRRAPLNIALWRDGQAAQRGHEVHRRPGEEGLPQLGFPRPQGLVYESQPHQQVQPQLQSGGEHGRLREVEARVVVVHHEGECDGNGDIGRDAQLHGFHLVADRQVYREFRFGLQLGRHLLVVSRSPVVGGPLTQSERALVVLLEAVLVDNRFRHAGLAVDGSAE